jgi:hypothetical protein
MPGTSLPLRAWGYGVPVHTRARFRIVSGSPARASLRPRARSRWKSSGQRVTMTSGTGTDAGHLANGNGGQEHLET